MPPDAPSSGTNRTNPVSLPPLYICGSNIQERQARWHLRPSCRYVNLALLLEFGNRVQGILLASLSLNPSGRERYLSGGLYSRILLQ